MNSAEGVRNVASILKKYGQPGLVVVISAMGKTTNALEEVLKHFLAKDPVAMVDAYHKLKDFHSDILVELFPDRQHPVFNEVAGWFDRLRGYIRRKELNEAGPKDYDFEYDQVVSYGELISTCIVSHYLTQQGIPHQLLDARDLVKTDSAYRDARVDWEITVPAIKNAVENNAMTVPEKIILTQGFIGSDPSGNTTTLGREGSDYTAAIFAFSLGSEEMTIWKDVPGVLNADPKWFEKPVRLESLSYLEAIELAYYGASVIHPKTIKPLENANITLYVKSFLHPEEPGTVIKSIKEWEIPCPVYIRKLNQVLISLSPRDFSFIMEENLGQIFSILARFHAKVNVMQNSAISFTICIDRNEQHLSELVEELSRNYAVRYNQKVELYTIRHYTPQSIKKISGDRHILMEQKTRNTVHLVVA